MHTLQHCRGNVWNFHKLVYRLNMIIKKMVKKISVVMTYILGCCCWSVVYFPFLFFKLLKISVSFFIQLLTFFIWDWRGWKGDFPNRRAMVVSMKLSLFFCFFKSYQKISFSGMIIEWKYCRLYCNLKVQRRRGINLRKLWKFDCLFGKGYGKYKFSNDKYFKPNE